ncbi:peptidoglycan editing factor PgeF [Clostridium sp.]|uniref:peptidoglycan editing factor PgeF n=1 Tax=Clostridium sp. TaxID=1506 RepID=UPI003F33D134
MNKIGSDYFKVREDFLELDLDKVKVVFSTAEKGRSFNRHIDEGVENLKSIVDEFNIEDIKYINQIHSDVIHIYEKNDMEILKKEGDAIVTNVKEVAVGVFTADCVPVIIVNEEKGVVGAIHSGWKGTFGSITYKTLELMMEKYDIDISDTKVFIGPHIRKCCYEVSEELKEKFLKHTNIEEDVLFNGRNLSMEECILKDLRRIGVKEENIFSLDICTHCEKEIKMHSYRSSVGTYGRLFSFAYIK